MFPMHSYHGHGGKPFSEFADRLVQDFLRSLRLLGDFGRFVADPGDGEQIFHHADEPLGVIPHPQNQWDLQEKYHGM